MAVLALLTLSLLSQSVTGSDVTDLLQVDVTANLTANASLPTDDAGVAAADAAAAVAEQAASSDGKSEELAELLAKPDSVFDDMTAKVSALEKQLSSMQRKNEVSLAKQAKSFMQALSNQDANNTALTKSNDAVKAEIEALRQSNTEKRARAKELTAQNKELTAGLHQARQLIATAHEFVEKSLTEHVDVNVPELQILTELEEKEALSRSEEQHKSQLDAVSAFADKPSLLQMSATRSAGDPAPAKPAAAGLVQGLGAGLSEYAVKAQESESTLKARFLQDYKTGADLQAKLLVEQKQLTTTRTELQQLNDRLTKAVEHLEKTKAALEERTLSVQGFAVQHLGHLSDRTPA